MSSKTTQAITNTFAFPVDGSYQPVPQETGQDAEYLAYLCEWTVVTDAGNEFCGTWRTERAAQLFANSMPTRSGARVECVDYYWYAPAWGRVDAHPRYTA